MGLRITPENRMSVQNSNLFYMQATSAESNVLNVASSLGRECLILTKFVKVSPMADFIRRQLRAAISLLKARKSIRAALGLSSSVQYRGFRLRSPGAPGLERPSR